jgi:hypothetical protein
MNSIQAWLGPPEGAKFIIQCVGGAHLADADFDVGEIWIESHS